MTSAARQYAFRDPAPSNTFPNAGNLKEFITFPLPTLAGSAIAVAGTCAYTAGTTITGAQDSANGSYGTALQTEANTGNTYTSAFAIIAANSIPAGDVGIATASSTNSLINCTGKSWTTNQWVGATVTLYNGQTATVTSNTATSLTVGAGLSSMASGAGFVVGGYIQVNISAYEDYVAFVAAEISGVSSIINSSLNRQTGVASGTNNITSGTKALGSSPVGLWGFTMNDGEENTPYAATASTNSGTSDLGTGWVWDIGSATCRAAFRNVANPGTLGLTFNSSASNDYNTFMIAFADSGGGAVTPAAMNLSQRGPGKMPGNWANQFRPSPRSYIPPVSAVGAVLAGAVAGTVATLSSFPTSGGLGFVPTPGPGVGPFSNTQFQASPRAPVSGAPQFLMAVQLGAVASSSAAMASLQTYAALGSSVASVAAALVTVQASGGPAGYQPQPGPGINPFCNTQFRATPLSTRSGFQALSGAASASSVAGVTAPLTTGILFGAVPNGLATVTPSLTASKYLTAQAAGAASLTAGLATSTQFAVAAASVGTISPVLSTGIVLGANLTGLSYASAALGAGALLSVTAAGLASTNLALATQTLISAAPAGLGSVMAALSATGQFGAIASASASVGAGLSASIQLSAQATGLAQTTLALLSSITGSVSAAGFASVQAGLATGPQFAAQSRAQASLAGSLQTAPAAYGAVAQGVASVSASLNGNVMLVASASSVTQVTARLLTVLQPPGEFADIRWLRAPRGGDVAYAEFFQAVGEQLWYGVNWEDWLASAWEANASALVGQTLRPTVANGLEFICTTAGQTGAVEPTWATYVGGITIDGSAMWQAQALSSDSLDDTISSSSFTAPAGITLDSGQVQSLRSYLIVESGAATVGTDYDVLCTIYTAGGQQKIAKLRIKVR